AFDVEQADEGVSGTINGLETLIGSKSFCKERNIDLTSVLLAERRMRREGYKPYIVAQNGEVLALIGSKQQIAAEWRDVISQWEQRGFAVRCLQEGERPPCELEMMTAHELSMEIDQHRPVVVIGEHGLQIDSPFLVTVSASDRGRLVETVDFCREVQEGLAKDLKLVTLWNKAGIGLAMVSPFTAPLINLMGDFLGVFLMSRNEWRKKREAVNTAQPQQTNRLLETNQANQTPYHAMEQTDLLHMLGTRFTGLTSDEVSVLRHQYGFNELEAPAPPDPMRIFLGQFKEFSTLILLGATGLSLFMGEWFNALCMGGILIVNAMIGTYQEVRSAGVLQALKDKDESQAKVVRGNIEQLLPTRDLVPGDIVLLEAGDMVPADLRILESWNLEVNEAILTGESLPAAKKADTMLQDTLMADRHNLMYMGTLVTRGRARALVVATGGATQIGALQSLLHQEEDAPTPLQQRVDQLGKRFVTGALIAGAVVGIAGLMRGIPPIQLLVSSITLAASAIPEGLPLTITIALTAGVMRMAKRKAVVRKLASLES
ncbi:MAG: HAD-IC family P-type ATPase, partial [Tumebacillaceae bacterium]